MSDFEDRRKAAEKKFELDEELKFKVASHASHLFAKWVAEALGFNAEQVKVYLAKVDDLVVAKDGHAHLIDQVEKDLAAHGHATDRHALEKQFHHFYTVARTDIVAS